jgi:hypothetical protein
MSEREHFDPMFPRIPDPDGEPDQATERERLMEQLAEIAQLPALAPALIESGMTFSEAVSYVARSLEVQQ